MGFLRALAPVGANYVRSAALRTRIDTHPQKLFRSNVPLTIVCGPPCAGKTTYAQDRKTNGDWLIDLDLINAQLNPNFRPWSATEVDALERAIKIRNQMLQILAIRKTGKAFFIVSAPTSHERDWWKLKLGGEIVLLNPGAEECKRRAILRGTPQAVRGIDDWFEKSDQVWFAPTYQAKINRDGWSDDFGDA